MSKNKTVIYTAIFGGKDNLIEPKFIPEGCGFVCFTDQDFVSNVWQVKKVKPKFEDPVRNARMYKVFPHKYLSEYEISVWIDGNLLLRGDINELIKKYLNDVNLAVFSHNQHTKRWKKLFWIEDKEDCRDCLYDEAEYLLKIEKDGKYKDNPELMEKQVERYKQGGYPQHNGLAVTMVILRKHNKEDVVQTMEDWWQEIQKGSRRDQLSFNYVAWKNKLNFVYMRGDSRRNNWFLHKQHKVRIYKK